MELYTTHSKQILSQLRAENVKKKTQLFRDSYLCSLYIHFTATVWIHGLSFYCIPTLLAGVSEAGAVFLLGASSAGASSGPHLTGLPEGPGTSAPSRGAQPHLQDGAGVRATGRPGSSSAEGPGEESEKHQELGQ